MALIDNRNWLAIHIFNHDIHNYDKFILNGILPIVKYIQNHSLCTNWFFIRYWEGGPHIRIRFLNPKHEVESCIHEQMKTYFDENRITKELKAREYYKHHKLVKEYKITDLPWYSHGSIIKQAYHPEYKRYGGVFAQPITENVFNYSSELAIKVLKKTVDNLAQRYMIALEIMLLSAFHFNIRGIGLKLFFEKYFLIWEHYVDNPTDAKAKIETLFNKQKGLLINRFYDLKEFSSSSRKQSIYSSWNDNMLEAYKEYLKVWNENKLEPPFTIKQDNSGKLTIASILSSHIHMTNNRIGVFPTNEHNLGYLAYLILKNILD